MQFYPPGARIAGRYEVAGRPMLGGMGIVYVCLDLEDDRPVALKTFRPEYLPDRAARDRFLREGTHWVELGAHPHIVRCYQVFRAELSDEVYLVLELVAKEQGCEDASLRSWLTPGVPLSVEQALLFALQVARGMQHAVDTIPGFVHRDLKPENVLVGADRLIGTDINRLRVTDFGLVQSLAGEQKPALSTQDDRLLDGSRLTRVGAVVGTPAYMAPEQWRGAELGERVDIYALGCILGEMLTGQLLVREKTLAAMEQAHLQGRALWPLTDLPSAVADLLHGCLAVDVEMRYDTWPKVEAEISETYEKMAGQAAPDPESAMTTGRAERVAAGWSYNDIGIAYSDIGKAKVALGYFERAREIGNSENDRGLEAFAVVNLGATYYKLGDPRQAVICHNQALQINREIGNRGREARILVNLGVAYDQLGDPRQAIGFYQQALEVFREIGDRQGEGRALDNLGGVYRHLGDLPRAVAFCEQALDVWRQAGVRRSEGATLGTLGEIYRIMGDTRRGIELLRQQLAISREVGDPRQEGYALGNLGSAYRNLGETRQAIKLYEQSLAVCRETGDRHGEGQVLGNLGFAYADLGDIRQAIEFSEQALAIQQEVGDVRAIAIDSFNLAQLYAHLGEIEQALLHAERSAQMFAKIGQADHARSAQQLAFQIRAMRG
jgi:tetratricopeptide (TPR) repeat protein